MKKIYLITIFVIIGLLLNYNIVRADESIKNATYIRTAHEWINPDNCLVSDNNYCDSFTNGILHLTNFNFTIPDTATIEGIEVRVEGYGIATNRMTIFIQKDPWTTSLSRKIDNLTTEQIYIFGSNVDLWGFEWNYNEINLGGSEGFAVVINLSRMWDPTSQVSIDNVAVKVYYSIPAPPPAFSLFTLPEGAVNNSLANVGSFIESVGPFMWLVIGLAGGIFITEFIISIIPYKKK